VSFRDEEIAYLQSQPIARLATVNADGQPDVVPVAFELDGPYIWVGGVGPDVARTRKLRNIGAGRSKVSLVIDDLVSMEPFIARALRVYGDAEPLVERVGMVGQGSTAASPRRCRGAGIWQVSPPVSGGMAPCAPCTSRDLR
jgi:pyridoxamine 5'-phosphate oxidase family protein